MMKFRLLALLFLGFGSLYAQYTDYFENYTPGEPVFVNWWGSWSGTTDDAIQAIESNAFNGQVSGFVPSNAGISGILSLDNKTAGLWQLQMHFYIPSGESASWNLQGVVPVSGGASIVGDFVFNQDGTEPGVARITNTSEGEVSFDFPYDQWFFMTLNFNFDQGPENACWGVFIDGLPILDNGTPLTDDLGNYPLGLGGVNFRSTSLGEGYLLDRFLFCDTSCLLSINDREQPAIEYTYEADGIRIASTEPVLNARIFDLQGRLTASIVPDSRSFSIPRLGKQQGIYVIELETSSGIQRFKVLL